MANRTFKLEMLESFSGGLNLRADQFNLGADESPDMLNVTVDPRGGIAMRKGVNRRNPTALGADVKGMWGFHTDSGTNQLMVNYGTAVAHSASGNFTALTNIAARTSGSRVYGVTFNNVAYGVSYDKASFKWDGSTDADLGTTWDSAGNMPQAQYITSWNNFVWLGGTYEGSASKYRVRWSNINTAETWTADDYVDVGKGEEGDYITGLVPAGDRLLVFKSNSVHQIFGWDSDSFQLTTLTQRIGSVPLSSPVSTPYGVFFWNAHDGLYLYDGERFTWLFSRMQPAIDDGRIGFTNPPQLTWGNNKLYVSVDWVLGGSATVRRTLVYDPSLGQQGAWTLSDISAGPLYTFRPPNGDPVVVAGAVAQSSATVDAPVVITGSVVHVDDEDDRVVDTYQYDAAASPAADVDLHIASHFRTPWVEGKNAIVNKRWGKPRMITLARSSITLGVLVYKDYDTAQAAKTFDVEVTGRTSSSLWGTDDSDFDCKWDVEAVGSEYLAVWAADAEATVADIKRLPTLGTAKAVSMRINGPTVTNNSWEVNALAFTYTPRRLR